METKVNWHLSDSGVTYANQILDEMQTESDRATSIVQLQYYSALN